MRRAGVLAFGSISAIISILALTAPGHALTFGARAAVVAAATAYFLVAWRQLRVSRSPSVAYFLAQNVLALVLVWSGRAGTVLAPMPIIVHAVLALRRRWVATIGGMHVVNWALVAAHYRGWSHASRAIEEMIGALVFVVAFAEVVAGERRARAALRDANRKLAEYATQAEELATTQERNRLARDLHDSLGHYLTVIHVQIQAAESQMEIDPDRARQALVTAARLTHEGLDDVRRSVAALRASPIDDRPLPVAIGKLVDELAGTGTRAVLSVQGTPRPLPPPVELALYRTAQEALTNVRKHARAQQATVVLEYEARQVRLSVADDGTATKPFDVGFGLIGVRERVRLVGGELDIRNERGFTVTVSVPV